MTTAEDKMARAVWYALAAIAVCITSAALALWFLLSFILNVVE